MDTDNNNTAVASREKLETEIKKGAGQISIFNLVNHVIALAYVLGASDIHIDPEAKIIRVRQRIDDMLQDEISIHKNIHPEVSTRIKILAELRTDEHQVAQDGRFCMQLQSPIDIRVSIIPTYYGENAVL